ncbi:hypothetical protein BD410DRAFT_806409 [Rickenella mellea]|uniref:Fungal-type protein kinase domain-containing protein n=1 Tax=Rickenella mellea TaxID=50990 RepID=A0A4Y7PTI5_9AGAM|nr:hypothetical protein BD410DRAFT_806409 [Rickenella mellea]
MWHRLLDHILPGEIVGKSTGFTEDIHLDPAQPSFGFLTGIRQLVRYLRAREKNLLMPYDIGIKNEAAYIKSLGANALEDKFHGLYNAILNHWFPSSEGYIIEAQVNVDGGIPEFVVRKVVSTGKNTFSRCPVHVTELKRPSLWTEAGKVKVDRELVGYQETGLKETTYSKIFGLAGIGSRWKMTALIKSGGPDPDLLQDWRADIASDASYSLMEPIVAQAKRLR